MKETTMQIRLVSSQEIHSLIGIKSAINVMAESFQAVSNGRAVVPARTEVPVADEGVVFVMPSYLKSTRDFGLKVGLWVPSEAAMSDSAPTLVILFNCAGPGPVGLLDGRHFTDLRTGAASGVATQVLAREEASTLAVIGAGRQARTQTLAVHAVRPQGSIRIFDRARSIAEDFAVWLRKELDLPASEIRVVGSAAEAVRGADIVVTATTSATPVFDGRDLAPGTHINAIGAFRPDRREVDDWTISQAKIVVDSRTACLEQAGDLVMPIQAGILDSATAVHAELGEILSGTKPGRTNDAEVTLFKSLGNAAQDAVLARMILDRAEAENVGRVVNL